MKPRIDLRHQTERRSRDELLQHRWAFELDLKAPLRVCFFAPGGGRFHDRRAEDRALPEPALDCCFGPANHRGELEPVLASCTRPRR